VAEEIFERRSWRKKGGNPARRFPCAACGNWPAFRSGISIKQDGGCGPILDKLRFCTEGCLYDFFWKKALGDLAGMGVRLPEGLI
jgi:hypothetical protein